MDFDDYPDANAGWGVTSPQSGDILKDAIRKEQILKEIFSCQEDLRAMLSKAENVQKEVDKLISGNETLQMYIDNLTVQMAKRR
ncbi:hypothetical protein CC1G_03458 [Coprinopsis cinerea okayama7|uniref:Uncharacterized protein n=1 Tax=Coprinopsis cinerea (strain Okayama-7 / 130 / ATCC MYA-4618 / FGSC 9003) TaxID=240176 RepID=A8NQT3_COPC7|nr:hypothetical protein CC1G_03458 [Coprinopsis cinerea okayama7\|eukprot:XP_001835676.1 hypothetical protein CC1G_03458 [Coprinopsis cinerea okayama7\